MAQIISGNTIKLDNGKTVQAQTGGWYDGQQYWNGTLSTPGMFNPQNNQPGQQGAAYVSPKDQPYIQQRQATFQPTPAPISQPTPAPSGTPSGTGAGFTAPQTPDLESTYQNLYESSGVRDIENKLAEQDRAFTEAKGKINDNPYLSEATRVGRVAKLEELHNERTKNDRDLIATRKADIETKLNLKLKQFDINSQAAQQALTQFNTLLEIGALNNASGDDIANITRSTGISSDMIYSAINANKAKNAKTQVITSTADSGEVTVTVINPDTGEIINQSSLGMIGNKQTGGAVSDTKAIKEQFSVDAQKSNFPTLVNQYANLMTLEEIYSAYANSVMGKKYGKPIESPQEINLLYKVAKGEMTPDEAREELEG